VAKFNVSFKKSALKQLRTFPKQIQGKILNSIERYLPDSAQIPDGKHIKKLTEGYRLRVGAYRVFYYIEAESVIITSVVRRTSTTY